MKRRDFLGVLATGAGFVTLGGLAACDPPNPWRARLDLAADADFPTGVLSGGSTPTEITLLIAVASLSGPPRLGLEVARDPGFVDVVRRDVIEGFDPGIIPWRGRVTGLNPGTPYWYRFGTRNRISPVGRFSTLPSPDQIDETQPIRFAWFSCQGYPAGYYTAHRGLADEPDLSLALCLGDYIYELTDDSGPEDRIDTIGDRGLAQTLDEYRQKYALYRSDRDLQAMHAAHALHAIWDNHELAEEVPGNLDGRQITVPLDQRIANGKQAFWDMMPMEEGPPDRALYRSLHLGPHVELFLLDVHDRPAPPGSGGSYLGAPQLAWLLDGLKASTARWKILGSQTVMMALELGKGQPVNRNQWDGYPEERARIVQFVIDNKIDGVVVLSGDLHTFLVAPVTTTGTVDGQPGLVELCGGAISSQGLLNLLPEQEELARALEDEATRFNPHLAFIDVLARGYGVVEADADTMTVTFRSPATVYERQSPMRTLARFRLRHGSLDIERLPV